MRDVTAWLIPEAEDVITPEERSLERAGVKEVVDGPLEVCQGVAAAAIASCHDRAQPL